jgi:hypothetical protein
MKMVEAGVEIFRDVSETERLLHDHELGGLGDPTSSAKIWWPRAERGQSDPAWVDAPALSGRCGVRWNAVALIR